MCCSAAQKTSVVDFMGLNCYKINLKVLKSQIWNFVPDQKIMKLGAATFPIITSPKLFFLLVVVIFSVLLHYAKPSEESQQPQQENT